MADTKADTSRANVAQGSSHSTPRSDLNVLRAFTIAAGLIWSILFVAIGLWYGLQMYGDGAVFSYSIGVLDSWAYHWHDISDRSFVFLFSHVPAEIYVAMTRDVGGGIVIYGFLQFVAPLLGLAATWTVDRSEGKIFFGYACFSTAVLCPMVFGFPTEMWMAHSLFWPALAICHYAGDGIKGTAAVFAVLLALGFTHPGALVLEAAILVTLALRGFKDKSLLRTAVIYIIVVALRSTVKALLPPDDYMNDILFLSAFKFIDVTSLTRGLFLLLTVTIAGYALAFFVGRRWAAASAHVYAAAAVAVALAIYWMWFDRSLHTDARYFLRTALLAFTPILAGFASLYALFSGWGVPSQRTVWMLATVALLRLGGRQWPWPFVWLCTCAVVVAVDPWALTQAGFWLSFVAVGVLFATGSADAGGEAPARAWRAWRASNGR